MQSWLVVGGYFNAAGDVVTRCVAGWDGTAWRSFGDVLLSNQQLGVWDLAVYRGDLYATNLDSSVLRRWNGSTWVLVAQGVGSGRLCEYGGELFWLGNSGAVAYNGVTTRSIASGWQGFNDSLVGVASCNGGVFALWQGHVQRWNGASWVNVTPPGDFSGYDLVSYNGEPFVRGFWRPTSSSTAYGYMRWDGQAWRGLPSPLSGVVDSLAVANGVVYAMSRQSESPRWNGTEWLPADLPPSGRARGLKQWRGELYAFGPVPPYGTLGVMSRLVDGAWRRVGAGVDASVACVSSNGSTLFIAGPFQQDGPEPLSILARWSGDHWAPLEGGPGPLYTPSSMLADGEGVIVGALFPVAAPWQNVARWENGAWAAMGSGWPFAEVTTLGRWNGAAVASGGSRIGVWIGAEWVEVAGSVSGRVNRLLEYRGDLIAVGAFTSIDGQTYNRVARWDGTGWRALGDGVDGEVWSACVFAGELYVSGAFSRAGSVDAPAFARWDGVRWAAVSDMGAAGISLLPYGAPDMVVHNGQMLAVRTRSNGLRAVARFDEMTWSLADSSSNGSVSRLCSVADGVVACGQFTQIGSIGSGGCALWRPHLPDRFVQQPYVDRSFDEAGLFGTVNLRASVLASGEWRTQLVVRGVERGLSGAYGARGAPATEVALTFPVEASPRNTGVWSLRISTDCGWMESQPVLLDFDGGCSPADIGRAGGLVGPDFKLDNNDFIAFVTLFFTGDPRADIGADGALDNYDFISFIDLFFLDCP